MDERYEALCGITQNELEAFFEEPTIQLAAKYQYTVKEMKELLRRQYDGYHFGERMTDIYNPFSILNAFDSMAIRDYWFSTGTPTYLVRLLQHRPRADKRTCRTLLMFPLCLWIIKADVEQPLPTDLSRADISLLKNIIDVWELICSIFPIMRCVKGSCPYWQHII